MIYYSFVYVQNSAEYGLDVTEDGLTTRVQAYAMYGRTSCTVMIARPSGERHVSDTRRLEGMPKTLLAAIDVISLYYRLGLALPLSEYMSSNFDGKICLRQQSIV